MAKPRLKLVTPATVNRTVTPRRRPNGDLRTREYLTEAEVEKLMNVAKGNRRGHRDSTMVLVAYRHGLRASELVDLRWWDRSTSKRPPCTSAEPRRRSSSVFGYRDRLAEHSTAEINGSANHWKKSPQWRV